MSLTYRLDKMSPEARAKYPDIDDGQHGEVLNPVTKVLVFATMALGIGEINEKTVKEFVLRITIQQRLHGDLMKRYDSEKKDWVDQAITEEHVRDHLGLYTNVGRTETRAAWLKRQAESVEQDLAWARRREEMKAGV
jgi:hypothetical protein